LSCPVRFFDVARQEFACALRDMEHATDLPRVVADIGDPPELPRRLSCVAAECARDGRMAGMAEDWPYVGASERTFRWLSLRHCVKSSFWDSTVQHQANDTDIQQCF